MNNLVSSQRHVVNSQRRNNRTPKATNESATLCEKIQDSLTNGRLAHQSSQIYSSTAQRRSSLSAIVFYIPLSRR